MIIKIAYLHVTFRFLKINCLALILFLVGCGSLQKFTDVDNPCGSYSAVLGASNVSLFLNIHNPGATPNVSLKFSSIEVLVDEMWIPFSTVVSEVNNSDTKHTQRFLGREWLKGQLCRGIRVKVAALKLPSGLASASSSTSVSNDLEIMLQNPFVLEPGSRKTLFLEWDPAKSLLKSDLKETFLSAYPGLGNRISANLVYVACPDIDTVYVVRADKFQVVDAFVVNGKPSYLAVDSLKKTIFVLSESLNKIKTYDTSTNFPISEINIALANAPNSMVINNTSQVAYVLDALGVLTSVDLATGNMLNRNRIGNRPNYICYISGLGKLAVSSSIDQTVYLLNPNTLTVEDSIALGSAPLGLMGWGNYLYIAEGAANSVSIYDLSSRKILKSIHVGFGPYRFVASNNTIYVTNFGDGSISIMPGGQFSVSKEIAIGKSPREMVVAEKQRLLFVGEGDCDGSLAIVDTTANQVVGRVELGAKPAGIAVIE